MNAGAEIVAHVMELLAPLGHPRSRRMFGGHGIYVDDLFIALVLFDRLYLKADNQTRSAFEAARCEAFTYEGAKGQTHVMSYWTAPAEALESSDEMRPWARRAIDAALRARAAVKPRGAKGATTPKKAKSAKKPAKVAKTAKTAKTAKAAKATAGSLRRKAKAQTD